MFTTGDRIWVPDPEDADGRLAATFLEAGSPGDAMNVGGRSRDVGWIRYSDGELEGTTAKVVYEYIRRRET